MPDRGQAYAEFIAGQLDRESKRREAIDGRALAVVTSSGAIVTLALAVLVAAHPANGQPAGRAHAVLGLALGCFLLAALLAVIAQFTWAYQVATRETLEFMVGARWSDADDVARNGCSRLQIRGVASLRHGNNRKAWFLTLALCAQCLGVAMMFAVVVVR